VALPEVAVMARGAWRRRSALGIAVALVTLRGAALAQTSAPSEKLSLKTEDDRAAWRSTGIRAQLGIGYGELAGLGGAPSGRLIAAMVRVGVRLDAEWSLLASFQYAYASARGGLSGLRFAGTVDPTWHVSRHWELAVGIGFGGIAEGRTGRPDPDPAQRGALNNPYTFPSARTPLPSCTGVGVAGLARASWMTVLGPTFSTGASLELDGQWTECVDNVGRVEPDTAQSIERRQFWPHFGGTLAWLLSWR
jgi:hypothetical protein